MRFLRICERHVFFLFPSPFSLVFPLPFPLSFSLFPSFNFNFPNSLCPLATLPAGKESCSPTFFLRRKKEVKERRCPSLTIILRSQPSQCHQWRAWFSEAHSAVSRLSLLLIALTLEHGEERNWNTHRRCN